KAEDQRDGGQRLFAARQQRERAEALARRLRHDFEPGFERIVRIDELEMRLPAVEQRREEALKMAVHRLERREQPRATFAVEAADRTAEAVHRLRQLLDLGGVF